MTRPTPSYDARDFDELPAARPPAITARHILSAVGKVLSEQQAAHEDLKLEIAALREKVEALERGGVKPKLVVPPSGSMIA